MVNPSVLTHAPYTPSSAAATLPKWSKRPEAHIVRNAATGLRDERPAFYTLDALGDELLGPTTLGVTSKCSNGVRRRRAIFLRREQFVDDREALCPGGADNKDEFLVSGRRHDGNNEQPL